MVLAKGLSLFGSFYIGQAANLGAMASTMVSYGLSGCMGDGTISHVSQRNSSRSRWRFTARAWPRVV